MGKLWDRITGKETRALQAEIETQRAMSFETYGEMFGAFPNRSGIAVSETSALGLCPWYSAVTLISDSIAMLPIDILQETATGNQKYKSNLWNLLNESANSYQTSFQFIRTMTLNQAHCGNAYAEIQRNARGEPIALNPLPTNRVIPFVKELDGALFSPESAGGRVLCVVYEVALGEGGEKAFILGDDVLHLTGTTLNGVKGLYPTQLFSETIGTGLAAEAYGNRFFSNGAVPEKMLTVPGKISGQDKQAMKAEWYKEHQGLDQSHRLAIIQNGAKLEDISQANDTNQFLETRKYTAEQCCQIFHIPPYLLGLVEKSAGNNSYEAQQRTFLLFTLLPFLANWRTELTRKCLTEEERNNDVYLEHNTSVLLKGDTIQRFQSYAIGLNNGFLCPNDVRRMEDLDDIENGNTFVRPLNMGVVGSEQTPAMPMPTPDMPMPTPDMPMPTPDMLRSRLLPIVNDICGRISRRREKSGVDAEYLRTALLPLGFDTAKLDNYILEYRQRPQTQEEMTSNLLKMI